MGKGAFVSISNETGADLDVSYTNIVGMYQHGEQGSDFGPISGNLKPHDHLPHKQSHTQYIEGISSGHESRFDMVLSWAGYSVTLHFFQDYHTYWTTTAFVKMPAGSLDFRTSVVQDGDQYRISVDVQYNVDAANWMGLVKKDIYDTPLCLLPIPGSHDAMSYPDITFGSQTQSRSISGQLEAGMRYFDFRVKVNGGVYYGVHGGAPTNHDYIAYDGHSGNKPYIFDDISKFLASHPDEIVILHFSHFNNFAPEDALRFAECITRQFGSLLVPRAAGPTIAYGACINAGQRVIAMVNDTGDDQGLAQAWYKEPAGTPKGDKERRDALFWVSSTSWRDRYSDIGYGAGVNLQNVSVQTLQDQEEYLRAPQAGQSGHRELDKFWVSQPILNCHAEGNLGHSWNYWAAMKLSPLAAIVYERAWHKGNSWNWDGRGTFKVQTPNIIIFDFAGDFDGFPEACVRMLKK